MGSLVTSVCCIFYMTVRVLILVPESPTPILPPVGVKTRVRSPTTIVVTWTDTGLGRRQRVNDNRVYTVRYQPRSGTGSGGPTGRHRQKMINTTKLNIDVGELRPDTDYEFSVRIVRGRQQSAWSLSVFNKTYEMGGCVECNHTSHPLYCSMCSKCLPRSQMQAANVDTSHRQQAQQLAFRKVVWRQY